MGFGGKVEFERQISIQLNKSQENNNILGWLKFLNLFANDAPIKIIIARFYFETLLDFRKSFGSMYRCGLGANQT